MKVLVYRIEVAVDPISASVTDMLAALKPFGKATIIGSSMRKVEDE